MDASKGRKVWNIIQLIPKKYKAFGKISEYKKKQNQRMNSEI